MNMEERYKMTRICVYVIFFDTKDSLICHIALEKFAFNKSVIV